eukprot:355512-Chlamydomonas_euryale.AAC.2
MWQQKLGSDCVRRKCDSDSNSVCGGQLHSHIRILVPVLCVQQHRPQAHGLEPGKQRCVQPKCGRLERLDSRRQLLRVAHQDDRFNLPAQCVERGGPLRLERFDTPAQSVGGGLWVEGCVGALSDLTVGGSCCGSPTMTTGSTWQREVWGAW